MKALLVVSATLLVANVCANTYSSTVVPTADQVALGDLRRKVMETERAFATSMADRDLDAFASYVSEEAVFFGQETLRGRAEVVDGWRGFFDGPDAPFSWDPEQVELLSSRTLAHSSGPVLDANGERVGTFNSVWRLEEDGRWRVVFDKGCSCRA
jgi:ketosteroid isomerase-like protein